MTNREIARLLDELADLEELAPGAEPEQQRFRVQALRRGARAIERLVEPAVELIAGKKLTRARDLGEGILRRVKELAATGRLAELEQARADYADLAAIAALEGVGPRTTRMLHDRLNVRNLDELEAAAMAGRLAGLRGFPPARVQQILQAIDRARAPRGKIRRDRAIREGEPLLALLQSHPAVYRAELCGSIRRKRDLIGDIDFICASDDVDAVSEAFTAHRLAEHVLARGGRTTITTYSGMQVDVFFCSPREWGASLHHWTGNKDHNIILRLHAARTRNYKITEHGVFRDGGAGARISFADEDDENEVYRLLDMPVIPIELREGKGEVEAAVAGTLPRLIEAGDLRGDLHVHTGDGDGRATLAEMAEAAAALGREYLAITDHSPGRPGGKGLDAAALRAQGEAIGAWNAAGRRPRLLRGVEVDILPDGSLDLPAPALAGLDWVIGAVHSHLDLPRDEQTRRMVRAVESGLLDAVAHPSGRLLEQRPAIEVDLTEVIAACARTDVALELNARPDRLDLPDTYCYVARERRAWIALSSDAHEPAELDLRWGVDVARRGWLEARDVLNTRPLADLLDLVRARRREAGMI